MEADVLGSKNPDDVAISVSRGDENFSSTTRAEAQRWGAAKLVEPCVCRG